eukprot:2120604-Pleurochrysis_carterae.AAC.1
MQGLVVKDKFFVTGGIKIAIHLQMLRQIVGLSHKPRKTAPAEMIEVSALAWSGATPPVASLRRAPQNEQH